jgi:hypothetical protein
MRKRYEAAGRPPLRRAWAAGLLPHPERTDPAAAFNAVRDELAESGSALLRQRGLDTRCRPARAGSLASRTELLAVTAPGHTGSTAPRPC